VDDQGPDGDHADDAAVAQRPHAHHVRPAGTVGAFPKAGVAVAARGTNGSVQERFDEPGRPADRPAAVAVTKECFVLQVVCCRRR
jgi:hypothetical protein